MWCSSKLRTLICQPSTLILSLTLYHTDMPTRWVGWLLICTWCVIEIYMSPNVRKHSRDLRKHTFLCYGLALLPSIICLSRLRIASKYIFTLWQLRQGVDSLAQWLEYWIFNREDRVRFPGKTEYFFQLCFIPLLRLSCRKMGARPGLDFIRRKWLHVIINDDFLEKGECYGLALLPSIICLGRLCIASKYIFTLWQLRQGVDSLAQWLEHWIFNREDRLRFPGKTEYFFQLCFIPLLRLSCRKTYICTILWQ